MKFIQYKWKNNDQFLNLEKVETIQIRENNIVFFMAAKSEEESYSIEEDQLVCPPTIEDLKRFLSNL